MKLKEITSWNLWLMPWSAPEIFQRPHDQALKLSTLNASGTKKDTLRIVAVQEAWAFRTGLATPMLYFMSYYIPRIPRWFYRKHAFGFLDALGFIFLAIVIIQGTTIALVLTFLGIKTDIFTWDPRDILYKKLSKIGFKHRVYANSFDKWWRMFDSGCAIFSTKPPSQQGFIPYENSGSFNEEALARKGIQFAYFSEDRVLIMNTHAKCDSHVMGSAAGRTDVASEMTKIVKKILSQYDSSSDEVYLCGDFNMTRTSESISRLSKAFPGSFEISKSAGSCSTYWRDREVEAAIDMVWCLKCAAKKSEWNANYVRERRRRGSLSPPENCSPLWGYLWMRSQDSDHLLLKCSSA